MSVLNKIAWAAVIHLRILWQPVSLPDAQMQRVRRTQGHKVAKSESAGARSNRLLGLLSDFGEHELIMAGCHENVLGMRFRDAAMVRSDHLLRRPA